LTFYFLQYLINIHLLNRLQDVILADRLALPASWQNDDDLATISPSLAMVTFESCLISLTTSFLMVNPVFTRVSDINSILLTVPISMPEKELYPRS